MLNSTAITPVPSVMRTTIFAKRIKQLTAFYEKPLPAFAKEIVIDPTDLCQLIEAHPISSEVMLNQRNRLCGLIVTYCNHAEQSLIK